MTKKENIEELKKHFLEIENMNNENMKLNIDGISINLWKILPLPYIKILLEPQRYNDIYGGKDRGGSFMSALINTIWFLQSGKSDLVILRRFHEDNVKSTFPTMKKVFSFLEMHIKFQKPRFVMDDFFHMVKSPRPEMTYLPTGRKIFFGGADNPARLSSMTSDDYDANVEQIWFEEPIEVSDQHQDLDKAKEANSKAEMDFEAIEDTLLRGEKAKITFSMNSWGLLSHWIYKKHIEPYYNYRSFIKVENYIERLETDGYMMISNPKHHQYEREDGSIGSFGINLVHACYVLLEIHSKVIGFDVIKQQVLDKKRIEKMLNPDLYKLVHLGIPTTMDEFILSQYIDRLSFEKVWPVGVMPYALSIDVGVSKDVSVILTHGTQYNKETHRHSYDDWYLGDEVVVSTNTPLYDVAMVMLEKAYRLHYIYGQEIIDRKIHILYHFAADHSKIYTHLVHAKRFLEQVKHYDMSWIKIVGVHEMNSEENLISTRVGWWQTFLMLQKIHFVGNTDLLVETLKLMRIKQIDGTKKFKRIEEGKVMDAINAAEIGMVHLISRYERTWRKTINFSPREYDDIFGRAIKMLDKEK